LCLVLGTGQYRATKAIVCQPCNEAKGSLSLQRFANRLARARPVRRVYRSPVIVRLERIKSAAISI
jgi:hypothetical protein